MTWILFVSLIILLILTYKIGKKEFIAPAFIFTLGFFLQSISVLINSEKWELGLHLNTLLVIVLGVFEFDSICLLLDRLLEYRITKKAAKSEHESNKEYVLDFGIGTPIKVLYLIFIIIVSVLYVIDRQIN